VNSSSYAASVIEYPVMMCGTDAPLTTMTSAGIVRDMRASVAASLRMPLSTVMVLQVTDHVNATIFNLNDTSAANTGARILEDDATLAAAAAAAAPTALRRRLGAYTGCAFSARFRFTFPTHYTPAEIDIIKHRLTDAAPGELFEVFVGLHPELFTTNASFVSQTVIVTAGSQPVITSGSQVTTVTTVITGYSQMDLVYAGVGGAFGVLFLAFVGVGVWTLCVARRHRSRMNRPGSGSRDPLKPTGGAPPRRGDAPQKPPPFWVAGGAVGSGSGGRKAAPSAAEDSTHKPTSLFASSKPVSSHPMSPKDADDSLDELSATAGVAAGTSLFASGGTSGRKTGGAAAHTLGAMKTSDSVSLLSNPMQQGRVGGVAGGTHQAARSAPVPTGLKLAPAAKPVAAVAKTVRVAGRGSRPGSSTRKEFNPRLTADTDATDPRGTVETTVNPMMLRGSSAAPKQQLPVAELKAVPAARVASDSGAGTATAIPAPRMGDDDGDFVSMMTPIGAGSAHSHGLTPESEHLDSAAGTN